MVSQVALAEMELLVNLEHQGHKGKEENRVMMDNLVRTALLVQMEGQEIAEIKDYKDNQESQVEMVPMEKEDSQV